MSGHRRHSIGFTLVETLVALAIFALIGAAAWQVLSSVMTSDQRLAVRAAELRSLNRAFNQLQSDIEQLVRRPVRVGDRSEPWLVVDPDAEQPLRLTRSGRLNPLALPRSSLQRVAYSVAQHPDHERPDSPWHDDQRTHLLRHSWSRLDRTGLEAAQVQVLIEAVDGLSIAVQGPRGISNRWPVPPAPGERGQEVPAIEPLASAPRALVVELEHPRLGKLRRLIRVF